MIKLFLADVDGTLVTEKKVLTDRAVAAVRRMRKAGIRFAVTSGRPPRGMQMLVEPLALDGVIAGFNGGVYVNPDMSVVETHAIDPGAARKTLEAILDHRIDAWVYTADEWLLRDRDAPHREREENTVKFPPRVVDDFGDALDHAVKITGVSDDLDLVARCEADVQKALGQTVSAARSQPYYLDVTHPNANKGDVVGFLAKRFGVDPQDMATIGDQPNDTLMFRKSGMSIAMGNASDQVKKQATHVTDGLNDEGFARAVERFVFGDAASKVGP